MSVVLLVFALSFAIICNCVSSQDATLVPALITFGDSVVDVGNNDYIHTIFKANYPPYGRDFKNQEATGRFCNGKLATDITAETLGFTNYPPAYLSPQASGKNLLLGANFASAGAGYDDHTSLLSHVIPLSQQLQYYKEYQTKLTKVAGQAKSASIIKDALYIVSAGSSDFIQNYYINPFLNKAYTPDQYSSYLVGIFTSFIKSGCVSRINTDAQGFNKKLNAATSQLQKQLPSLKIVVFDVFKPLYDIVADPKKNGFTEATKGCCGTGTIETTSLLCNPKSIGTCPNATEYVFWDSVHPSQAANQILADSLLLQGIALIS
ncbi:GDSL esterase/lipase APG [Striga asiatica]|uniref:GDSL esterase/lipase APG n=1 Tax=Striga asiatica TaxID=4170 RepID=A0A5A7Q3M1_STRAF|nr:GDSL esterase/lipase APG [Striga asiatica]